MANSATEWVELYNSTGNDLDISGHYIDDRPGGGAPKQIPANTIIPAYGYYVMTFSNFLANSGDEVRFLDPSQNVLDATAYSYSTAEHSWYRYPDGGRWSSIDSAGTTPGAGNTGLGDEPWQAGTFEIRIFDVDQGDSQLIIFPSGYSILIDVRESSWNSGKGARLIAQKIWEITGSTHVNVGMLSHLHLDHIGYAGFGGFWALMEVHDFTFDKIVDRDAGTWVDGHGGGVGAYSGENDHHFRGMPITQTGCLGMGDVFAHGARRDRAALGYRPVRQPGFVFQSQNFFYLAHG